MVLLNYNAYIYCKKRLLKGSQNTFKFYLRFYQNDVKTFLSKFPDKHSQVECERFWSRIWAKSGLFKEDNANKENKKRKNFRMLLPPPNITGALHIGHSLTVGIQDTILRFHRMNGYNVKWYGGTDHAGIATQIIIENKLWAQQKKTRHDVNREEFYQIFETWKNERIEEIQEQLTSLGASIDHDKNYFTLSPQMSGIVNEAFINLFNRGLIYRQSFMVNWSYYLQSTLSDIEIEHKFISKPTMFRVPGLDEEFQLGVLHTFKYPLDSLDSNETVQIATTRIESLMGDVALCVNPNDERNRQLIGRVAINPFTNRAMPILGDSEVKPDFGTGVLKLTPAHSTIDFEIAQRHNLPSVNIFDDHGRIHCDYQSFNGIHRYAAKEVVRKELERLGLYCGYVEHPHWLPICSRSGDIIENRNVPQWFLRCDEARYMAEFVANRDNLSDPSQNIWSQLKDKLQEDERNISIIPSSYRNTWKDWFSRYKDWCISRQIFYGHRIPAYQIIENNKPTNLWVAARNHNEALIIAKERYSNLNFSNIKICQDSDVLDTWFSSALLPLTVTGYFDKGNSETQKLSLMETGHDIIFFWVARMVLISLLISGKLPFDRVLLHGMVCDSAGKKMSKSKGNVVNPMHLIHGVSLDVMVKQLKDSLKSGLISEETFSTLLKNTLKTLPKGIPECGADVLRLTMLQANFKNQNFNFDLIKSIKKRSFTNKMHNTVRFITMNLNSNFSSYSLQLYNLTDLDKWILNKFTNLLNLCRTSFESYDLHIASRQIERFWIKELCDIYLESVKSDLLKENKSSLNIFVYIVKNTLILLHPFMPFITENLYQQIEFKQSQISGSEYSYSSVLLKQYPSLGQNQVLKDVDTSYLKQIEQIFSIVRKIRWFRQYFFINKDPLIYKIQIASLCNGIENYHETISKLIGDSNIEFVNLFDIYKHEDCYIVPVDLDTKPDYASEDDEKDPKQNPNSLTSNEIYLLFTVDEKQLKSKLTETRHRLSKAKIDQLMTEFNQLHSKRFSENYKRITKLVN